MMIYTGNGNYIPDIPARDLTDDEAANFGAEFLASTGLYVSDAPAPEPPVIEEDI